MPHLLATIAASPRVNQFLERCCATLRCTTEPQQKFLALLLYTAAWWIASTNVALLARQMLPSGDTQVESSVPVALPP